MPGRVRPAAPAEIFHVAREIVEGNGAAKVAFNWENRLFDGNGAVLPVLDGREVVGRHGPLW